MLPRMLSGLTPVALLNAMVPLAGVSLDSDLPFAPGLTLDVYSPRRSAETAPVVVFFYGGGWDSGDKAMYRFLGATLARRGLTCVIPDYRVYPEVRFPDFLSDAAAAVGWTVEHLRRGRGRPVLMGHSAGAHIAAMLALDTAWLARVGLAPDRDVAGLVGLSGPYDFLPLHSARLQEIFGPEQGLAATQPINFVAPGAPPALLAAGRLDTVVDPQNAVRLARRLEAAGGSVTLRLYPRARHADLLGAFAWPLRFIAPALADTLAFVDAVTAGHAASAAIGQEPLAC